MQKDGFHFCFRIENAFTQTAVFFRKIFSFFLNFRKLLNKELLTIKFLKILHERNRIKSKINTDKIKTVK
jgi:hypothetical protein